MSNALYLLASLPMLKLGDQPPLSIEELRYRCTGVMSEQELSAFDALVAGEDHEDSFVASYYAHETQLKNVAGRLRAAAWGPDVRFSERSFVGFDVTFAKMVSDAFAKTDPLEREMDLDKARFWLVDELAGTCEDSIAAVYAFTVKLMICCRWNRLSEEAGNATVLQVINDNDPAFRQE